MHAHVDDGANDTPSIREVEIHLVSEFAGLVSDNTENYVTVVILGIRTRDKSLGVSARNKSPIMGEKEDITPISSSLLWQGWPGQSSGRACRSCSSFLSLRLHHAGKRALHASRVLLRFPAHVRRTRSVP